MSYINRTPCCGVHYIDGVDRGYKRVLSELYFEMFCEEEDERLEQAFFIFTDALRNGNGRKFAKQIDSLKLGKVTASRSRLNPNSGNMIRIWTWSPDVLAIKEWGEKNAEQDEQDF